MPLPVPRSKLSLLTFVSLLVLLPTSTWILYSSTWSWIINAHSCARIILTLNLLVLYVPFHLLSLFSYTPVPGPKLFSNRTRVFAFPTTTAWFIVPTYTRISNFMPTRFFVNSPIFIPFFLYKYCAHLFYICKFPFTEIRLTCYDFLYHYHISQLVSRKRL